MAQPAALKSRFVVVKLNGTAIAGVRTKSLSIAGSPIDISSDDDDGIRKLLDVPGQVDVNIQVSGLVIVTAAAILRNLALARSARTVPMQFSYGGSPDTGFQGMFFPASYSENGEYNGAMLFEGEFQSADQISYA
jgi:predicted secreted protein